MHGRPLEGIAAMYESFQSMLSQLHVLADHNRLPGLRQDHAA